MATSTPTLSELAGPSLRMGAMLAALIAVAHWSGVTAMTAPFSATCALLVLLPRAPFSTPRTVFVAHLICVGVGVVCVSLPLASPMIVLLAAWVSIMLMAKLRVVHAPAVAHAVILSLGTQDVKTYALCAIATASGLALYSLAAQRRMPWSN